MKIIYKITYPNGNAMTAIGDGGNEIMIETLFEVVVYPILKYTDCNCKWRKRTCL